MGKVNRKFPGLSQYRGPLCYELAGKTFRLVMDNGKAFSLDFPDEKRLRWCEEGNPPRTDEYRCLKGDDTTYLVHLRLPEEDGRFAYNWILDTAQRLVTLVILEWRYEKDLDHLVRSIPYFGAIDVPGLPLPELRHHFSARMVGGHIFWHYNPGHVLQHIYHSPRAIRASTGDGLTPVETQRNRMKYLLESPDPKDREEAERSIEAFRQRETFYPLFEEPCFHIWIKENLNLFCFVEEIMCRRSPNHDQGGGGLLLLQDIERLLEVGVSFSARDCGLVAAYGDSNETPDPFDTLPTPYAEDWKNLTSMPSIYWDIPEE